jgi:hypothetical protein
MNRILFCFAILSILFSNITKADTQTEQELITIIKERKDALAKGDKPKWKSHISDSCLWAGENVATTAEVLDSIIPSSKDFRASYELSQFKVQQYGDVAIVTYLQSDTINRANQNIQATYRYLDTYIHRDNKWQLIAASETFVPPPPIRTNISAEILKTYVGDYQFSSTSIFTITLENGKLIGQVTDQEKSELIPENETTFFSIGESARYIFAKNDKGNVDRLIYRTRAGDMILKKVN